MLRRCGLSDEVFIVVWITPPEHTDRHTHIHPNAAELIPVSDNTSYYVVQSCRLITAFQEGLHDSVWSRGCSTEPHTVDVREMLNLHRGQGYDM